MANREPATLIYGNTIIKLERGQLHTSEIKLMDRWGWSKKKVRAYLLLLKSLNMATAEGTAKGTTITVENYSVYQDCGTAQDTEKEPGVRAIFNRCDEDNQKKDTAKDTAEDTAFKTKNSTIIWSLGTAQDTEEDTAKEPRRNRKGTAKDTQTRSKELREGKEDKKYIDSLPSELQKPVEEFIQNRKAMKKPMTDKAVELMLKELNKLSGGDTQKSIKILEQSIRNGWLGIFPLKETQSTNPFKEALRKELEDERQRSESNHVGYQGGLSKLLQEPDGD